MSKWMINCRLRDITFGWEPSGLNRWTSPSWCMDTYMVLPWRLMEPVAPPTAELQPNQWHKLFNRRCTDRTPRNHVEPLMSSHKGTSAGQLISHHRETVPGLHLGWGHNNWKHNKTKSSPWRDLQQPAVNVSSQRLRAVNFCWICRSEGETRQPERLFPLQSCL